MYTVAIDIWARAQQKKIENIIRYASASKLILDLFKT